MKKLKFLSATTVLFLSLLIGGVVISVAKEIPIYSTNNIEYEIVVECKSSLLDIEVLFGRDPKDPKSVVLRYSRPNQPIEQQIFMERFFYGSTEEEASIGTKIHTPNDIFWITPKNTKEAWEIIRAHFPEKILKQFQEEYWKKCYAVQTSQTKSGEIKFVKRVPAGTLFVSNHNPPFDDFYFFLFCVLNQFFFHLFS